MWPDIMKKNPVVFMSLNHETLRANSDSRNPGYMCFDFLFSVCWFKRLRYIESKHDTTMMLVRIQGCGLYHIHGIVCKKKSCKLE